MKYSTLLGFAAATLAIPLKGRQSQPQGIDVSDFQTAVDWNSVVANGISFAFIKATEGTTFISDTFSSQYTGATDVGLIRGAYHFAHPDDSSGADQANFFLGNGGGWSADGKLPTNVVSTKRDGNIYTRHPCTGITLPGVLDIEYNPNGDECYDLSASDMVSWVQDFSNTYEAATGRFPIIYTTTDWWTSCTGNSAAFANDNPLWIAHYASSIGALPAGWDVTSFWQYADSGPNPGDADLFNGDAAGLQRMALGS